MTDDTTANDTTANERAETTAPTRDADTIPIDLGTLEQQLQQFECLVALAESPYSAEPVEVKWLIGMIRTLSAEIAYLRENQKPTDHKIPSMDDEALRKFVQAYCNQQVFTSWELINRQQNAADPFAELPMVFMPLAMGALSEWTKEELDDIGLIYEYMSEAGPRAINGNPCFVSFRIMNCADWKRAAEAITKELDRRREVTV